MLEEEIFHEKKDSVKTETDSRDATGEIRTDVEGAGGGVSIEFKLQQVAGLGVVS